MLIVMQVEFLIFKVLKTPKSLVKEYLFETG